MKHVDTQPTELQGSSLDRVIEWLLISLLAFMPLAFGVVEAWSEEIVVFITAAMSICFMLKLSYRQHTNLVWSWAYIPVVLFILLAVFQLIPLPAGVMRVISPGTSAIKKELLGDLPNSINLLNSMTISFYAKATKQNLRLVLAVATAFFIVVNVCRRPDQIKRLLMAIAVIGGSISLLALAQDIFGNGKIYWVVPSARGVAYSGPFVNHSHYGQFMNLSIGAAFGLILVNVQQAFTGKTVTPLCVFDYLVCRAARVTWFLVAMIVIGTATVFLALTRGGIISMLIAAGFTTLVLISRQALKGRGWIIVLMALGAFTCVVYIGFDAVYERLATLRDLNTYTGRWQIIKDLSVSFRCFPILGTGLGTHEFVYPMFDRSTIPALAAHAENEYAQAAEETGLVGLASLIGFAIIVWRNYVRNVRSVSMPPVRSAAYGLGFGLLAIMLHSLTDFGQHLPANACLSAVFCALLLSLSRTERQANPVQKVAKSSQWFKALHIAAWLGITGVWAWALFGADSARLAEAHWKKALAAEKGLREKDWLGSNQEYIELISNAGAAVDFESDNIKYRHWLNVYRWRSMSRVSDPNTGKVIIPTEAIKFVRRIVDELNDARRLCPTYGATCCVVGQFERFILDEPAGADHIRKGFRLAPCDPTACFIAGLLDAEEQQIDASFDKFSRAIQLDGTFFKNVADTYINHLDRPDLAVAIAGDNTGWLSYVTDILGDTQEHKDIAHQTHIRVKALLEARCQELDAPAWQLASLANIYRTEGNYEAAIDCYRRALMLEYGQTDWRLTLARLLADAGAVPEAIHQARVCLRLRPQFEAAEKLVVDLSVYPDALVEENRAPKLYVSEE